MRSIILFSLFLSTSFSFIFAVNSELDSAKSLAQDGIIVDQSSPIAQWLSTPTALQEKESQMYRLSDFLSRQEALGIALKLQWTTLDNEYVCRGYFPDTREWWVCRAAEIAADNGIVTRKNTYFRPKDTLTFAEALGITLKSLDVPLSTSSITSVWGNLPDWQKRLVLTIQEINFPSLSVSEIIAGWSRLYPIIIDGSSKKWSFSQRITRWEFFQLIVILMEWKNLNNPTAHCTVYNDGCNDCTVYNGSAACTKKACFWQGIPSCSLCESGYKLQNNRCVKETSTLCIGEWKNVSNYSLPPEYQYGGICCAGLTNVSSKEGFVGSANICARVGDGYCNTRFESSLNSSDCSTGLSCVKEGGYAGGGYVMYPEDPNAFQCCAWLTRTERKDGSTLADAGYTCINQGDAICDSTYESEYNSSDCRGNIIFDKSICQSYYDGCNSCSRTSNGQEICTLMFCPAIVRPQYCTSYVPYIPQNLNQDAMFLNKIWKEIENYTKDLSCSDSSQCRWKFFGAKSCGGSSVAMRYSEKNIDANLFTQKTTFYTDTEKLFNQTYSIMSDCSILYTNVPSLSCINNLCQ